MAVIKPNTRDAVLKMERDMKSHTTVIEGMERRLDHLKREKTQNEYKFTVPFYEDEPYINRSK